MHRSRSNRMLAGVAGGLAEYLGIDAVVLRVLFAVLSVFGGAGILLYLLGWLLLPDETEQTSPAESLVGRGTSGGGPQLEAVLLAVAALVLGIVMIRGDTSDLILLGIAVLAAVFLMRRLDERRGHHAVAGHPSPPPPAASFATGTAAPAGTAGPGNTAGAPVGPAWPTPPASDAGPGYSAPPRQEPTWNPAYGYGAPPSPPSPPPPPVGYPPPPPPSGRRDRHRSVLGLATVCAVLIGLGVLAAFDSGDALDPAPRHYLAVTVGGIGLGLLLGTWIGRARWLVALGVPLALALVAVSTLDAAFEGGAGDRRYHPVTASAIMEHYQLGAGSLDVDLSDVDFQERVIETEMTLGVGSLHVVVPADVDVRVDASASVGELRIFDVLRDGGGIEYADTDFGADGVGGGHLRIVAEVALGEVVISRASS